MKPVVSAFNAWSCTVISIFAVIILSVLGSLFARNHHVVMGMEEDPDEGTNAAVASSIFIAVAVYAVYFPGGPSLARA